MSEWRTLKERVIGRWQIPLLALATLLLFGSVLRLNPPPSRLPFDEAVQPIEELVAAGLCLRAVELGDRLLAREDATDIGRALVHLSLARARYVLAVEYGVPSPAVGRQIVEHFDAAARVRARFTATDRAYMGRVYEWQGRYGDAVEHFESAIENGIGQALDLRRRILLLHFDKLDVAPERASEMLKRFLAEVGQERLDLRIWAIERQLDTYELLGRLTEPATLLARNHALFEPSSLRDRFQYLEALVLYKNRHFDEAEIHLRTLRNRLESDADVYAMSGWLLGRVVLADGGPQRPQEALSFFSDVLRNHPHGGYAVASRVGSAEAMAMLERHDEALDAYQFAIDELVSLDDPYPVSREALRASLGVSAEAQRQVERFGDAIEYARLAVSLVDRSDVEVATLFLQQLAQLQFLHAVGVEGGISDASEPSRPPTDAVTDEGRRGFAEAAATYLELAQLSALSERPAADANWWAAGLLARAGQRDRAAELYRAFAKERPQHPLVPRALLRIGQLLQGSRQFEEAVEVYQECYRRFPRTLEGSRTLVPLAQSFLAMGAEYEELAERTLHVVLDDSEVITPEATEFIDAMFLLGDVLTRRGHFERAIAVLEETLERYPSDARVWQARFRLAGAYRQSGLALKAEAAQVKSPGEFEQMRVEVAARFQSSRTIYREFITRYELSDPESLTWLDQTYLRHAYLYEADCFFETQDYRRALTLYEQAAGLYKDTPSALAAYVQIINSNAFLGRPDEARAALARALVLVGTIPDSAFRSSLSPERRADWKRYFDWLESSELF